MKLHFFIFFGLLALFGVQAQGKSAQGVTSASHLPNKPNVVIVFTDDQGYADLGQFGAKGFSTPNIDAIADNGVLLTDFYVPQAICSASRAALLTGSYPNRISINTAFMPGKLASYGYQGLHPDEDTMAEILRDNGYRTAIFGKWHLGDHPDFMPTKQGFDEFFGIPYSNDMWTPNQNKDYAFEKLPVYHNEQIVAELDQDQSMLTTEITQHSVDFIQRNKDKPFFMFVTHPQPHVPLFVSDKFKGKSELGLYGDVISEIDWSVGQIVLALKDSGVLDNTIVIFTSDNGPWLEYGDHAGSAGEFREGKQTEFEGGVRVPFVMQWPAALNKSKVIDIPMMTIDLLPTIVKLTGSRLSANKIDGKNIWPILSGMQTSPAHPAYFFYHFDQRLVAVRYGGWKLYFPHTFGSVEFGEVAYNGKRGKRKYMPLDGIHLYNLKTDPSERNNVADQQPVIVSKIKQLANGIRAELGDALTNTKGTEVRPVGQR